jgi:hypothetical protein
MVNMQAAALDPNFSDPQVYGPQRPAPQPSVLDMLRGRLAREMEGEALQRASEFGAGMLASGSPNFFTMLGGGARAAQQGDASRMDRLRQIADAERQQRALDIEEQRRQEELRLRREEMEMNAPYREAQAEQARALAEYYRQGGRGGAGATGQITPALRLRAEQQANAEARREFPDPPTGMPISEARQAEIRNARQQYVARRLPEILEGLRNPSQAPAPDVTAAPRAPAAVIDLRQTPGGPPPR